MLLSKRFYLSDIASHLGADYVGPREQACSHLGSPHDDSDDTLVLCFERRYLRLTERANISGCVVVPELSALVPSGIPKIIVDDPKSALTELLRYFNQANTVAYGTFHPTASIDPSSEIHPTAHIGAHCSVGAHVIIGPNVQLHDGSVIEPHTKVGEHSIIHSRAVLHRNTRIGSHVRIGAGAVIGALGFNVDQHNLRFHLGYVEIGNHSSVGANSCIDRGLIGSTRLGSHSHLDNLVQIGHNAQIGDRVTICGQVGIAGSVVIGDDVIIGGQTGITHGITVVSNVRIAAQSGVTKNIKTP
ncbi:MAG: UDP-3-O-(3-hydroxymyristoyl)glucosamine N-acyltransferase, partial [Bradymonadia bacterium]